MIQLLSKNGEELERIELHDDAFKLVVVCDEELEFTFWSDDRFVLRYLGSKRRVLIAPAGIHYSNRLSARHLIVEQSD